MNDKEKLEKLNKLADAMYYAAQYLTTDASRLHKAMEEYHQFIINEYHKEEPVSYKAEDEIVICLNGKRHKQVLHNGTFSKNECKEKCSLYERCQNCSIDLCMIFFHDNHCHFVEEAVSEDKMTISKEWFEHCKKSWYNEGYIDGEYNRDRQFKESVSEDLEEFINTIKLLTSNTALLTFEYGCREGAKWQLNKIRKENEKNRD